MSQLPFEPDGVYAGIPYRILENGQIDAIMSGTIVRFRSVDQLVATANKDHSSSEGVSESQQNVEETLHNSKPKSKLASIILGGVCITVILFTFVAVLGHVWEDNQPPLLERVKQGCQKEFGLRGDIVVNDCVIRLMTKKIQENNNDALNRAYSHSR